MTAERPHSMSTVAVSCDSAHVAPKIENEPPAHNLVEQNNENKEFAERLLTHR